MPSAILNYTRNSDRLEAESSYLLEVLAKFPQKAVLKTSSAPLPTVGDGDCFIHAVLGAKEFDKAVFYPHAAAIRGELINFLRNVDWASASNGLRYLLLQGMEQEGLVEMSELSNPHRSDAEYERLLHTYADQLDYPAHRFLNNVDTQLIANALNITIRTITNTGAVPPLGSQRQLTDGFQISKNLLPKNMPKGLVEVYNPNNVHYSAMGTSVKPADSEFRDAIIASYLQKIYDNNCGINDTEAFQQATMIADQMIVATHSGTEFKNAEQGAFQGTVLEKDQAPQQPTAPTCGG